MKIKQNEELKKTLIKAIEQLSESNQLIFAETEEFKILARYDEDGAMEISIRPHHRG